MSRLDKSEEILALADQLGLSATAPVESILNHCRHRIDGWVEQAGGVADIGSLESLVTQRLQMVFEEIRTDADFERLTENYARAQKDPVFASLRFRFDDEENPTYGALIKRRHATDDDPERFVAVIDCRGDKLARRFFTRWHEIAHRLTTHADGGATEPGYRSEHDPIERLMDEIAGHIGFYEPIFRPAFQQVCEDSPRLTFGVVQAVVSRAFPIASFQATLIACVSRLPTPVLYLEAAIAHKIDVQRKLLTPSLFGDEPPSGELRAVKVISNPAALREKFMIPMNMRVPADSLIQRLFEAEPLQEATGEENLSLWESQGRRLENRAVVVQARKVPDRVLAIVQPVG